MYVGTYNPLIVLVSFLVAILASYTALDMAGRITLAREHAARRWLAVGAFAMGTGIWSMHFIGMLAFSLPIALGYDPTITFLSLLIAIASSAFALWLVSQPVLPGMRLALGASLMGAGIAGMHYTGMAAMRMVPAIQYIPALFLLSIVIAMLASGAALWIAFRLRRHSPRPGPLRSGAAVVMGLAIVGMHYTAMAAAQFPLGSICGAARNGMNTGWLAFLVTIGTVTIMAIALTFSVLDRRLHAEERFRAAVESAPIAMVMIERTGSITLVNALTETLFGYQRDELLGRPVEILLPKRYRAAHPQLRGGFFQAPVARRMGVGRDLFGLRKDGSEFLVEIGLNPVETSDGVFVLAAIADITERKRAEEALRQRTEELDRSNRELEQFAYVASHDLQEPLRAIAGPLTLLQRRYHGQLDARADEFIEHAVDGASRMQALIDDLLAFSRVGRSTEPLQQTDCTQALDNALKNLKAAVDESGAQISCEGLPTVRALSGQISVLFQNLVGNAIKFRHKDRPLQIDVGADARDDGWVFHVRDNGIGIEPAYFERIFLIFQRLHTHRDYPGTGIGLALCKRIAEHHGGGIWVESEPGNGSTFFFSLPRQVSREEP